MVGSGVFAAMRGQKKGIVSGDVMSDLVKRLQKAAKFGGHYAEAATEIERLQARNELLEGTIKVLRDSNEIATLKGRLSQLKRS